MIESNLISSKTVIAKVIADLQLNEEDLPISDFKEYIYEAMQKIGAIQQYEHKVVILPVVQHQVKLPCDLYRLGQVAFSFGNDGGWLPMRKSTSSFGVFHDRGVGKAEMIVKDNAMIPLVKNMFNLITDEQALAKLNEDTQLRKTLSILLNQYTVGSVNGHYYNPSGAHKDSTMFSNELQYTVKPGYINVNIPDGFVKISYSAIYSDEDGMPLIPNLESYKEAILWYITMKYFYPKYLKGDIDREQYRGMRQSWNFYRKQAYAEATMPSIDDMESIKNIWNKLYPEIDDHDTFFSTTGDEQQLYNQNKNYWDFRSYTRA